MLNKESYKRAFSALHTTAAFTVSLEDKRMKKKRCAFQKAMVAAGLVMAMMLSGTAVYANNIGGIQRTIQIWVDGELTDGTINIDEGAGQYKITDDTGKLIGCGGGVAFDEDGKERPLTAEELYNYAAEEMTTDVIDGRMYLLYKNKKIDITDEFADKDVVYVTLKDDDKEIFVTVEKNGGLAYSPYRYQIPGKDFYVS